MKNSELNAEVAWHADDIQALRPHWSVDRCNDFLDDIESGLQEHMINKGWEYIRYQLTVEDNDGDEPEDDDDDDDEDDE